jgi:hypothetical protein
VIIVVKRVHIDNGVANSSTCCPIALACKDAGLKNVWVTPLMICYHINDNDPRMTTLPQAAIEFVHRFDFGLAVTMFSFDLPV